MAKRVIVQGALHVCNPCIACVLQSTVTTISELVRLRTFVKQDFHTTKVYQKQQAVSAQQKPSKEGKRVSYPISVSF